jgi:hypothetical protein
MPDPSFFTGFRPGRGLSSRVTPHEASNVCWAFSQFLEFRPPSRNLGDSHTANAIGNRSIFVETAKNVQNGSGLSFPWEGVRGSRSVVRTGQVPQRKRTHLGGIFLQFTKKEGRGVFVRVRGNLS